MTRFAKAVANTDEDQKLIKELESTTTPKGLIELRERLKDSNPTLSDIKHSAGEKCVAQMAIINAAQK